MTTIVVLNYSIHIQQFIYQNFHISRRSTEHKSYTEVTRRCTIEYNLLLVISYNYFHMSYYLDFYHINVCLYTKEIMNEKDSTIGTRRYGTVRY